MVKQITNTVKCVGKTDWELKTFHGEELSTAKGSSYNSFLIEDEKTVLIDTIWQPYDKQFVANLKNEIDIKKIDYIICNHAEVDHSGALPELMREIPQTPIYCTKAGESILRGHYHMDLNYVNVKTGDTLPIGKNELMFIEAKMLHWPDTMFTYMRGENVLFSNDGFGQHYASEALYADEEHIEEIMQEAIKYYANILSPFNVMVAKKLKEILAMDIKIDLICPSHGVFWRKNFINTILDCYEKWSNQYSENQITIVYDTMWDSTKKMADAIYSGIYEADKQVTVKFLHAGKHDKNDIVTEVFKSKCVLFGAPTVNNGLTHGIAGLMELLTGLKLKGKKCVCFGSYGWSGESVKLLNEAAGKAGFEQIKEGLRVNWVPDEQAIALCKQYGVDLMKNW